MGVSGSSGPNQSAPVPRAMPVLEMLGLAPYETWIWYGDGGKVGWPAPDVLFAHPSPALFDREPMRGAAQKVGRGPRSLAGRDPDPMTHVRSRRDPLCRRRCTPPGGAADVQGHSQRDEKGSVSQARKKRAATCAFKWRSARACLRLHFQGPCSATRIKPAPSSVSTSSSLTATTPSAPTT